MDCAQTTGTQAVRAYRYLNGNTAGGSVIATTLDAQSKLHMPTSIVEFTDKDHHDNSIDKKIVSKPYRLNTIGHMPNSDGTLLVRIGGIPLHGLFDTGAQLSLVTSAVAKELVELGRADRKQVSQLWKVASASGHLMKIEGRINASVEIGRTILNGPFLVSNSLPYDAILGRDIMKQLGPVTINYAEGRIPFKDEVQEMSSEKHFENEKTYATVAFTAIIPPLTECVIAAHAPSLQETPETNYLIQKNPASSVTEIVIAPSVSKLNSDGNLPVRILNPNESPVKLHAGTKIAISYVLTYDQLASVDLQSHATDAILAAAKPKRKDGTDLPPKFKELDLSACTLGDNSKKKLMQLLLEYQDIFSEGDHDLEGTKFVKHEIHTGDAPPIRQKPYRTAFSLRETIRNKIQEMLKHKIIEPSVSEWASPIVMVKKKDGTWRSMLFDNLIGGSCELKSADVWV